MMLRKYLITTLCCLAVSHTASLRAAKTISNKVIQNGSEINIEEGAISPAPLTFFLNDPATEGIWKLDILNQYGRYESVDCPEGHAGCCVIEPRAYDWREPCGNGNYNWSKAYRDYDPITNRDYFNFRLTFIDRAGNEDVMVFRWGLLPSIPMLSDFEFTYEYDWEEDMIFPNGILSFTVESEDSDIYWLNATDCFLFEYPGYSTFVFTYDSNSTDRIYYDAEWGEYLNVGAVNNFGIAYSEMIYTTDYITDRDILDRIQAIRDGNGVDAVYDSDSLSWDNERISFGHPTDACIFDPAGIRIREVRNTDHILITDLQKGMYIVVYNDGHNIHKSKIFKR